MAAFDRLRAIGEWWRLRSVTQAEYEAMDAMRPAVLNGLTGSTHAPSAPIIIGGAGLECTVTPSGAADVANKAYVDAELVPNYARYVVTGSQTLATNDNVAMTQASENGGFSINGSFEITVPAVGVYHIDACLEGALSDASNPAEYGVRVLSGGASMLEDLRHRYNTTTAQVVRANVSGFVIVTDVGVNVITMKPFHNSGNMTLFASPSSYLHIFRVGKGS